MIEFMKQTAREAGQLMLSARAGTTACVTHLKAGNELVTSTDLAADALISTAIRQRYPGHEILAEESAPELGKQGSGAASLWIVDPIDGTVNFAHGHYQSAVSIAFAEQGQLKAGVVYNPFLDEMFWAQAGAGAYLNSQRIQVAGKTDLRRALVATGFPYDKDDLEPLFRQLAVVLRHCADIRRLGSAALDICWVAMGRLDAYYESLSIWDFAAAQLIATEAGACYGHFKPVPEGVSPVFHNKNILVSNQALFPRLQELLLQA
ncbi:MAG: inositol monophosphatase family protein [Pseudomonadales bacterium]|nr:inositol monophosphatase family protein [Pseudomonadales bacterium]